MREELLLYNYSSIFYFTRGRKNKFNYIKTNAILFLLIMISLILLILRFFIIYLMILCSMLLSIRNTHNDAIKIKLIVSIQYITNKMEIYDADVSSQPIILIR